MKVEKGGNFELQVYRIACCTSLKRKEHLKEAQKIISENKITYLTKIR